MKKHKKMPLDCFGSKRLSDRLFWPGLGILALCGYLWQWSGDGRFGFGFALGFVLILAAAIIGWLGVICPRCGAPLYDFPRLPSHIPAYCPRCGEKITPEQDQ